MERRIKLKSLSPLITCKICKGYLIDATTVTECLHTFCKSCLVKHLEEKNTCPTCKIIIHQSHPLNYISHDRTLQDIVDKLVPGLQEAEQKREQEFYRVRGLTNPKENLLLDNNNNNNIQNTKQSFQSDQHYQQIQQSSYGGHYHHYHPSYHHAHQHDMNSNRQTSSNYDYHREDEQIGIELVSSSEKHLKQLKLRYIRCSSQVTMTHLKKFISKSLFNTYDRHKEIDILYNGELLGKDHTLKFVFVTRWRFKQGPLKLYYKPALKL